MLSLEKKAVRHEAIGLENVGNLVLHLAWRSPKKLSTDPHREWHGSGLSLPLSEIEVTPNSVLFWDHEPGRSNSLRRFGYMLGLRADATELIGGNSEENIAALIKDESQRGLLGYSDSRVLVADMTSRYLSEHPGHIHRANAKAVFRYCAPDKAGLAAIKDFLTAG